jgi:GAF domain-containing protein/HAMP domain-containing protein
VIANQTNLPKRTISLRARLALSLSLLTFVAVGISLVVYYFNYRAQLQSDLKQRLIDIVSLAALQQDGDKFVNILSPDDPEFERVRLQNLKIRNSEPDLRFLYTMRYDDQGIYFVVDAVTPGEAGASPYGTRYYEPGPVLAANYKSMVRPMVEDTFYTDEYGTFMSAYAPFYKSDGSFAGIIAADITARNVLLEERAVLLNFFWIFLVAIALVAGAGWFLGTILAAPITSLTRAAVQISRGDLGYHPDIKATSTEVALLEEAFYSTAGQLQALINSLERRVNERTEQLRATLDVGRAASSILDPDALISRTVNLITDRFGYYYAAIFLVDPTRQWADLKDATGDAGKALKAQGHRLEVGGKSMVGTAINSGEARVALDVGTESVRFNNPLLPDTHSEIALPLIVGDRTIGALDVQSTQSSAFGEQDIIALQGMVNQVAIALENARLFQETQISLDELRTAQRQYLSDAWSETQREHSGYEFISGNVSSLPGQEATALNVPLTLREQIIGQLRLEGLQSWTPEERGLIEAVATQATLALENARLLEDSQQLALRERLVAEITGKIWASPSIETILQTAIKELGRALRADDGTIELKLD